MDLNKVKEIITPRGSLKKILRSGVTIWSKNTDLQYTIWKNGVLIKRVTMPQFVKEIQNGTARTDYGIGAQIYIPYTDPWNKITYDLPFNFGTFTSYPSKLGLQAHYALPAAEIAYRSTHTTDWENTYVKAWFNTSGYTTARRSSINYSRRGLLGCLPEDFVEVLQNVPTGPNDTECKMFLLTATQYCASTADYDNGEISNTKKITVTCLYPEKEGQVWEYWRNKIGTLQAYNTTNSNHIIYSIGTYQQTNDTHVVSNVLTISRAKQMKAGSETRLMYGFKTTGEYTGIASGNNNDRRYQPACVIG